MTASWVKLGIGGRDPFDWRGLAVLTAGASISYRAPRVPAVAHPASDLERAVATNFAAHLTTGCESRVHEARTVVRSSS